MKASCQSATALRSFIDTQLPGKGKGACLPASAVLGFHITQNTDLEPVLVRGVYQGKQDHWWLLLNCRILDPTAGQFGLGLPTVLRDNHRNYTELERFPLAYSSVDMLYAEARQAFGDSAQAHQFVDQALITCAEKEYIPYVGPVKRFFDWLADAMMI